MAWRTGNHTYTPNSLNQYASITTDNSRTAIGRAPAAWNVEVDGVVAGRTGELYHRPVTATNGTDPVWKDIVTRRDTGAPSTIGHFWYAATPFSPVHDADGNLTNDGRWSYVWNAENRLIQMESTPQAVTAGHPYTKVVNSYDWQGRRITKHVWKGGTAASPVFASSTRWLYNGWNEIAEFSASSDTATTLTRQNTFTWGLDLSGSLHGAGGVGGLLVQTAVASGVREGPSYDGNGNIVAWTKSTATAPTARREYDAFGNTVVSEGAWPSGFGFSTKRQDVETGLCYYGYRYYDPATGRWLSRDPIGERGGVNLYSILNNNILNKTDNLGCLEVDATFKPKSSSATEGWNLWLDDNSSHLAWVQPVRILYCKENVWNQLTGVVTGCHKISCVFEYEMKMYKNSNPLSPPIMAKWGEGFVYNHELAHIDSLIAEHNKLVVNPLKEEVDTFGTKPDVTKAIAAYEKKYRDISSTISDKESAHSNGSSPQKPMEGDF